MNRIVLMVLRNLTKVPGLYAKLCRYAKDPDKYPEQERWDHIRHILQLAVKSGNLDLQVTGVDNIPAPGSGFMMYANHQGLFDVVAIAATCPTPLGGVVKKELEGVPFVQQIIDCTKSYPMDREDVRQSLTVIQNVTEEVKQGRNYLIFPEGTRNKERKVPLLPIQDGVAMLALRCKAEIVPSWIGGKYNPISRVRVYTGEKLDLSAYADVRKPKQEDIAKLNEEIRLALLKCKEMQEARDAK